MPRAAPAAAGGLALALVFRVNCAGPQAARAGGQAANQDQIGGGPATAFELASRRGSPAAQEPPPTHKARALAGRRCHRASQLLSESGPGGSHSESD